ncbi:MAG: hypothetical protein WBJ65_14605, partial [Candidatus Microthrix parvicella]
GCVALERWGSAGCTQVGVRATHEAIVERAVWLRHELGELPGWRIIDDPATASGIVSLAPSGAIGTHADTVGRTQRELAERGVRVTASQLHHAPIAMESLGVGAALRLAPQADQPWNDLRRAVEVLGQATD